MNNLTKTQLACQTQFTRTGVRDMKNKKPYRTTQQKIQAKKYAKLVDGRYVASTPKSFH